MSLTMTELKETLKNKDEHAKTKDDKITSLEKDVSNKDTELKKVCTHRGSAELSGSSSMTSPARRHGQNFVDWH